jgi:dephospho-CoA kinase
MKICIVGQSCAGKTTASEYIESEFGIPFVEGSDLVWERYSDSAYNGGILEYVKKEYQEKGRDTFAQPVIDRAEKIRKDHVVLSGFRTAEEIRYVIDECENVSVITIHANSLLRYQRRIKRDPHSDHSYKDFIIKDFEEYDFGIARTMADFTDYLIINESTYSELYDRCDEIIDRLLYK